MDDSLQDQEPYFIAEIGLNHNGDVRLAKQLIDICINASCDAVKFQKREVSLMFPENMLNQPFSRFPELGDTMREVRESLELGKSEYRQLREYCSGKIDFIVTPFDHPSVEFLDDLDLDGYKIASHSVTDIPLLRAVSKRRKPVIASVGMSNSEEVTRLVTTFSGIDLTLLHCVSSYPTKTEDANLGVIEWLKQFGCRVGYSDHENGIMVAPVAVALGAKVIEKHVTLDKSMPGFDHAMSIEPYEIVKVVQNIKSIDKALKKVTTKRLMPTELQVFDNRRGSIYAAKAIQKGQKLDESSMVIKAPLRGLTPRFTDLLIGAKALYDINEDEPITFGLVDIRKRELDEE